MFIFIFPFSVSPPKIIPMCPPTLFFYRGSFFFHFRSLPRKLFLCILWLFLFFLFFCLGLVFFHTFKTDSILLSLSFSLHGLHPRNFFLKLCPRKHFSFSVGFTLVANQQDLPVFNLLSLFLLCSNFQQDWWYCALLTLFLLTWASPLKTFWARFSLFFFSFMQALPLATFSLPLLTLFFFAWVIFWSLSM